MNVLVATGIYPPSVGGPATYAKLLYDELPKRDVRVEVVSFDSVRSLPVGIRHMLYFCKLLLASVGKDVVYTLDPVSVGYPAMWVARLTRKPLVLKMVGDYAWEQGVQRFGVRDTLDVFVSSGRLYHSRVMRLKRMQEAVARAAERIVVPSVYLQGIVASWGISKDKISVIYNAFESSVDQVPTHHKARELLDVHVPTIITAGRLVPWKGIGTLIACMPELIEQFPKLKLVVVGSGPNRDELEQLVRERRLYSHVEFRGALPQDELFLHIRAADVFVLNTGYEGFSHQLLEVLALGTPVVTTSVGGNPEIIADGKSGLLVPYNDTRALIRAITQMLTDDTFRDQCVEAGRVAVEQFSTERLLNETLQLLKKVV